MKSLLLLIPALLATTAALADSAATSPRPDAHAQAAALLSRPQTPATLKLERPSSVETPIDAHASAAALLSGERIAHQPTASSAVREPWYGQMPVDAHSQAAALLSGTRIAGRLPTRGVHDLPTAATGT
jgi:hypothetical protein